MSSDVPNDPPEPPVDRPEELPEQPDASDEVQIRKRVRAKKIRERTQDEFLRAILADQVGRKFLWSILTEAHAFETRFALSGYGFPVEMEIWMGAGAQDLGQRLYQTWDFADHDGVSLMLFENDVRFKDRKKV